MRYRNVSGHAEVLADGRVVGYLGNESYVDLSDEDLKHPDIEALVEQEHLLEAPEPEVSEPTLEDLKKQAKELNMTGYSSLNKEELQQAINEELTAQQKLDNNGGNG